MAQWKSYIYTNSLVRMEDRSANKRDAPREIQKRKTTMSFAVVHTLCSRTRQVKVDSPHHGNKQRQGRRPCQKSNHQQNATIKFGVIMDGRPHFGGPRQESKIGLDNVIDKALKFGRSKIGGSHAPFGSVMNHEGPGQNP